MKNLTIFQRIMLLIGAAVTSLLLVGYVGLSVGNKGADSIKGIDQDSLAGIQLLGDARQAFTLARVTVYAHILAGDESAKQNVEKSLEINVEKTLKLLKDYEKLLNNDEDRKLLAADISNLKGYSEAITTHLIAASRKNDIEVAREVIARELVPIATPGQSHQTKKSTAEPSPKGISVGAQSCKGNAKKTQRQAEKILKIGIFCDFLCENFAFFAVGVRFDAIALSPPGPSRVLRITSRTIAGLPRKQPVNPWPMRFRDEM